MRISKRHCIKAFVSLAKALNVPVYIPKGHVKRLLPLIKVDPDVKIIRTLGAAILSEALRLQETAAGFSVVQLNPHGHEIDLFRKPLAPKDFVHWVNDNLDFIIVYNEMKAQVPEQDVR